MDGMNMSLDELSKAGGGGKSKTMKKGRTGRFASKAPYSKGGGSKRVYVGNLSWDVSWQDLKDVFRECGDVVYADVMTEGGKGGRSKGCGIVEFSTAKEAKRAISELHDTEINGRLIFCREDREDKFVGGGASKGAKGGKGGGTLFVGNLPWEVEWQELKDLFAEFGEVEFADIPTDREGRSKGFGLVTMASGARRAMNELNGQILDSRELEVRFDRDTAPGKGKGGKGGGRGRGGGGSTSVYVGNLSWDVAWQDLKDHMREAGEVSNAEVFTEGGAKGGRSKGCGIVTYYNADDAQNAIDILNDTELNGRLIFVREDRE